MKLKEFLNGNKNVKNKKVMSYEEFTNNIELLIENAIEVDKNIVPQSYKKIEKEINDIVKGRYKNYRIGITKDIKRRSGQHSSNLDIKFKDKENFHYWQCDSIQTATTL